MKKRSVFLYFIVLCFCNANAQDTLQTLNAEQVILLVKQFHPIAKQADIVIQKSDAGVTLARGAFNPIIGGYLAQKNFSGTEYYDLFNAEIKIPTWYGIELSGGLQELNGQRLDPSESQGKTSYAGISVPLAKNLIIDKRRAFLQQAKLYQTMAKNEQRALLNDILLDALEQYWNWVNSYQTYLIVSNNVKVNELRFNLIKRSYQLGERPAIDTIEALTQLQTFKLLENNYLLAFKNSGLQLSAYLWQKNNTPYYITDNIVPQKGWENEVNISSFNLVLVDLITQAESSNPNLLLYNNKIDILSVDKRLKFQELLPKIDLRYNHLNKNYQWNNDGLFLDNNYQYGIKFEMPLFLSEGRGQYRIAKLKLTEAQLDLSLKQQQVSIKVKQYFNEYLTLKQQITLQSSALDNYKLMLTAEENRYYNGESSLFLINSRETKALEAQEKLIELKTKYFKTIYALQWSAGLLK